MYACVQYVQCVQCVCGKVLLLNELACKPNTYLINQIFNKPNTYLDFFSL